MDPLRKTAYLPDVNSPQNMKDYTCVFKYEGGGGAGDVCVLNRAASLARTGDRMCNPGCITGGREMT
jgi:hypothetical protein